MSTQGTLPSEKEVVEALLFATDEPLSLRQIVEILTPDGAGEGRPISPERLLGVIEDLNRDYGQAGRAFRIVKVAEDTSSPRSRNSASGSDGWSVNGQKGNSRCPHWKVSR